MTDKLFKQAERRFAKKFGTTRNWLSRTKGGCEDFMNDEFAVDVKSTTGKKSIMIQKSDVDEIRKRALHLNRIGLIGFRFFQDTNDYAIINVDELLSLVNPKDSLWECLNCSHYNRVELKNCENCGHFRSKVEE
jgi:hypothetical protein